MKLLVINSNYVASNYLPNLHLSPIDWFCSSAILQPALHFLFIYLSVLELEETSLFIDLALVL